MAKTMTKAAATKATPNHRAAGKSAKKAATAAAKRIGAQNGRLNEKTEQMTLRAFRAAYLQHSLQAAAAPQTVQPAANGQPSDTAAINAKRNGAGLGQMSEKTKQLTIRAFQLAYEQHQQEPV